MAKENGRGKVLHGFAWSCWNCCCSVCTFRNCPYPDKFGGYVHRCARCVKANGKIPKVLECDFFENRHTSRQYFKVKRRSSGSYRPDSLERKFDSVLDLIVKKLGNLPSGKS